MGTYYDPVALDAAEGAMRYQQRMRDRWVRTMGVFGEFCEFLGTGNPWEVDFLGTERAMSFVHVPSLGALIVSERVSADCIAPGSEDEENEPEMVTIVDRELVAPNRRWLGQPLRYYKDGQSGVVGELLLGDFSYDDMMQRVTAALGAVPPRQEWKAGWLAR